MNTGYALLAVAAAVLASIALTYAFGDQVERWIRSGLPGPPWLWWWLIGFVLALLAILATARLG